MVILRTQLFANSGIIYSMNSGIMCSACQDFTFMALTIVDNYSGKCHAKEIGQSLKRNDVVMVMDGIKQSKGILPERIQVDNGSEFISKEFDRWAYENHVTLDYSLPGRPTDKPVIESFNGS